MISEARRKYWDDPKNRAPREKHDLTDSVPYPFERVEYLFAGKDVLEIGPGRGRQYERLRGAVKSYSICDISSAALREPVFYEARSKYLIEDYSDDFVDRFDVVHFWYVLHHVLVEELDDFFAFVERHLRNRGIALFNTPQVGNAREWYTGDGLGTTWMDQRTVYGACRKHLAVDMFCEQDERSSGFLFKARKRKV